MRLLLAEDERSLSKALVAILEYNHYSVDAVYDGAEALDYLKACSYDGVILDIMMPRMDGISVLKEFRKTDKTTPVLLLTAKNEVEDRVLGLDSGADDYLGKPFDVKELLARIRAMLRRGGDIAENTAVFCDVQLSYLTFELSSPKGSVRLGNKEFQIMEMLISAGGKVVSAEQIFDKVWGPDSDAEIQVVWTYVSFLRKKLASLSDRVSIKALRNFGYVLESRDV